jgi:hypothetical protein
MQAASDVPVRCIEQMQHRIQVGDDLRAPTCTPQRCTLGGCTVLCTLTQQGILPQLPGTTYYLRDCIVTQTKRNAAEVGAGWCQIPPNGVMHCQHLSRLEMIPGQFQKHNTKSQPLVQWINVSALQSLGQRA